MSQEDTLLSSGCELLTHDWVKSFLFPCDRTAFVRQLHGALSQQDAITASLKFGTQTPGPVRPVGLTRELSLLCVPSFSTGSITVGFEITACVEDTSPRALGIPRYIARFARDDDEGVMLIVAEHPTRGMTQVTCCTLLSPGCRSQIFALMGARDLRNGIMNLGSGPGWRTRYATALRDAVIFAYFSIDMRKCPNCGGNASAMCHCRLAVKRKAHPLDHDAERENLSTYTGAFGGMGWMRDVDGGRETRHTFVSSISAEFTHSRVWQRELSRWAMTHVFGSERMRVGNYAMPRVEDCTTEESASASERTNRNGREKRRRVESEISTKRCVRQAASVSSSMSAVELPPSTAEFGSPCTPIQEIDAPKRRLGAAEAHSSHASRPPRHTRQQTVVAPTQQVLLNVPPGTVLVPVPVPVQHPMQGQHVVRVQPVQQTLQMQQQVPIRIQGLLPTPAIKPTLQAGPEQRRMSKDEIRRARNRASAQRSNEKKKREVAKLKDDLEEYVRRKELLQERETKLRDENRMLRKMLGVAVK